jgi:hypothetical protein
MFKKSILLVFSVVESLWQNRIFVFALKIHEQSAKCLRYSYDDSFVFFLIPAVKAKALQTRVYFGVSGVN